MTILYQKNETFLKLDFESLSSNFFWVTFFRCIVRVVAGVFDWAIDVIAEAIILRLNEAKKTCCEVSNNQFAWIFQSRSVATINNWMYKDQWSIYSFISKLFKILSIEATTNSSSECEGHTALPERNLNKMLVKLYLFPVKGNFWN